MTSTLPESRVKAERRIPAGLFLLLVTSLLNTFGCNGVFKERSQPLPYRLAVIPFGVGELGTDGPGTAGGGTGGGLMLRVEPSEAQKALVQRLSGIRFVQAAVLAGAGAGPEEPSGEEKDRSWIRAAVDARANLIMECDLKVGHRLESRLNEKFWLNLPLFLIGGPATYFVDDRSYRTPAHLLATIHLVEPLVEGRATLSDGRAILLRAEAQFEEASLAYYQRARLNPLSYLASLVIPCGFLEIENERVIRRLEREVTQGLAEALDRQLEKAWPRILRAEPVSDFYLDPGVEAVRDGDRVSLTAEAVLRLGTVPRLDGYTIACGGKEVTNDFPEGLIDEKLSTPRHTYLRYRLQASLVIEGPANSLEIEVRGGGRDRQRRTFCVPLPDERRLPTPLMLIPELFHLKRTGKVAPPEAAPPRDSS